MLIKRLSNHQDIVVAIKNVEYTDTFLHSAYMLNTFFNNVGFELWSIEYKNKIYIFVKKLRTGELRFLFVPFPEEVIDKLKAEFDPPYIAYNDLPVNPEKENQVTDDELIINVEKYISFDDKKIKKHYHQAIKSNISLAIKLFNDVTDQDLNQFWKTWFEQRVNRPFAADRTHNDKQFISTYLKSEYFGVAAYDGKKLVAYSIGIKVNDKICLSSFNKCLRGYKNLGLQISYEKAKIASVLGFKEINVGGIGNDFKKHFLKISRIHTVYSYEIFRKPDFPTKTPNGYANVLLR